MTIIFQDTFSVASDELLTAHAPDTGNGWTLLNSTYTAGDVLVKATGGSGEADVCAPDTNQNSVLVSFVTDPAPSSSEYDITVTVYSHDWSITNTYLRGIFGRYNAGDAYFLVIVPNGHSAASLRLYKRVSGSNTLLGESDATLANGDEIKLEIRDAAKKVYHNNVEVISSADNALAAAGSAGMFFGNEFGLSGHIDRRQEFGAFTLDDQAASGITTVTPSEVTLYSSGTDPTVTMGSPATTTVEPSEVTAYGSGSDPAVTLSADVTEVSPPEVTLYASGSNPIVTVTAPPEPPEPPPPPEPAEPYVPDIADTTLPAYQIVVLDPETGAVRQIYGSVGLEFRYSRELNGIGSIVITLDAEDGLEDIFTLDSLIEVYRAHPVTQELEVEETYLTRRTHRFREDERDFFLVGGVSLNHLIRRRVVNPADDPLEAGGYSTKDGEAHTVLRAYAREQMGDLASTERQVPNLSIPEGYPGQYPVGARLRFENLLEVFQDLAQRGRVDFHIRRVSGAQLELMIAPIGVDRTLATNYARGPFVYLSPERGNLTNPSLEVDSTEEATFVYAQGQGQGSSRVLLEVPSERVSDSPFNRVEIVVDARTTERSQALALFGEAVDALHKNRPSIQFTFQPTGREPGNVYRLDWDLGDRVTAFWGRSIDVRITTIDIDVSEQGEQISVTVENDDLL